MFERLISNPPKNIDGLLLEGSSLGRVRDDKRFPTEKDIEALLTHAFRDTEGLALVHASAQNIDRVVSIFRACRKTGRKLVVDLYAAAILEATGNRNIPQSNWPDIALFVPQNQRLKIKKNGCFDLLKRHSSNRIFIKHLRNEPSKFTMLFRPLHRSDLEKGRCLAGALYVYSQWEGYWRRGDFDIVKDWLERNGIPRLNIHTSGHASLIELKRMVAAIEPRKVIPIHTFLPNRYSAIFPNVELHDDGEIWEV